MSTPFQRRFSPSPDGRQPASQPASHTTYGPGCNHQQGHEQHRHYQTQGAPPGYYLDDNSDSEDEQSAHHFAYVHARGRGRGGPSHGHAHFGPQYGHEGYPPRGFAPHGHDQQPAGFAPPQFGREQSYYGPSHGFTSRGQHFHGPPPPTPHGPQFGYGMPSYHPQIGGQQQHHRQSGPESPEEIIFVVEGRDGPEYYGTHPDHAPPRSSFNGQGQRGGNQGGNPFGRCH